MDRVYNIHPFTKEKFSEVEIPSYNEIKQFVSETHKQLYNFDMVSWDIVIDQEGSYKMIEYNLIGQEINFHQINNGPLFGKYTTEILNNIYNNH